MTVKKDTPARAQSSTSARTKNHTAESSPPKWKGTASDKRTLNTSDADALPLTGADFQSGSLKQDSNMRPNRLFTAEESIVLYSVGRLTNSKITEVANQLAHIFQR